jgi:uncharacterized protein (TIGR03086 family)
MSSTDTDLLDAVLQETEATIADVKPDQLHLPTPCSDYNVADLIDHLVGWARSFAGRFTGTSATEDPNDYRSGTKPAVEFHQAAQAIVGAYRTESETTKDLPTGFIVMEFLTHCWDLAAATNRSVNLPAGAAQLGLRTAKDMLKPEYRGSAFLAEVPVLPGATAVEQLVGFMGRNPGWQSPA